MNRYLQCLLFASVLSFSAQSSARECDIVIGDFESKDFGAWTTTGNAFGSCPLRDSSSRSLPFHEFEGSGVAGSLPGKEAETGELISPEFEIQRRYINFLVWGQRNQPAELGVELLVGPAKDRAGFPVARAASATEAFDPDKMLRWRTFDVGEFAQRQARLRVNDHSNAGSLVVDSFIQSDEPKGLPVDASRLLHETFRPQFHFTAQSGWLNDANGLLYQEGRWHLFHQHRLPGAAAVAWGHAISSDLLHWTRLPTAIPNDGTDAIFSGSGWVDSENVSGLKRGDHAPLLFFYTLHPAADSGRKAVQCLAFSTDGGVQFQKSPGNPLLQTPDRNDRDPKVFYYPPTKRWFLVLSLSRNNADRDHATYGLFRSLDLKSWELIQEIGPGSWYWECPDLFELPLDGDSSRKKWILAKGSGDYIVGTFDGERFRPETKPVRTHWGASYYGAQTFSNAPDGRRIQVAWMNSGRKELAPDAYPGMPFNQQMSFPRELSLRTTAEGPRMFRKPIPEISQLWTKIHTFEPGVLMPGENPLAGIHEELLDLDLEMELAAPREVILNLRGAEIVYDSAKGKLRAADRVIDLPAEGGKVAFRVLLDRTSYELFANGGLLTHSKVFFPDPENRRISLIIRGGLSRIHRLVVREVKSIWGEETDAGLQPPRAPGAKGE